MADFLPSFDGAGLTILAFIIALSVIVAIHEFGHYIVGRWCGIHADVFSLGMGPVLFSTTDRRGTVWQVAALPIGGYVKFRGDGNAASAPGVGALEGMDDAQRRSTMQGAAVWRRSLTVLAGPVFNFILSMVIFAGLAMVQGMATGAAAIGLVKPLPYAAPFQPGDQITAVDGVAVNGLADLSAVETEAAAVYDVLRDGAAIRLDGPAPMPAIVDGLSPKSAAVAAGLLIGDVITAANGVATPRFQDLQAIVKEAKDQEIKLTVWRDGRTLAVLLTPRLVDMPLPDGGFEARYLIGISGGYFFTPELARPGLGEAVAVGAAQVSEIIRGSISGLVHMVAGNISTCNLQGPVGIAEVTGEAARQGGMAFLVLIAVLSTAIGFVNLFPIPVLDGGHLLFHLYEGITGKAPSDGAMRLLFAVGMALILTMMLFALSNDLFLCP
jgi:regulator of sigma E protease